VMPEFDNNQFWKVDQGMDLEALLQDYQWVLNKYIFAIIS
jgi:hypothetical protein